ncbi:MAG: cytochrome b [Alphaproteobacteria bacterium]|jgi:quinol-cytochrome oxidoreductase complex cytochrome b subunit
MSDSKFKNPIVAWIDYRLPVFSFMEHELHEYPTPKNLNYWWNFGSLAGIILVIMIVTGIVLAMHYTAHTAFAFDSVERIMRDVNYGWLIRYIHMNGASAFFIVVYIHIFRGMYFGSYKSPREILWILGVVILLTMMATAFLGYVLPWGQMSFWGATVITNLFSAIPIVGDSIVTLLWGGFSVDNPTLNRFFSLHYLMPFVLVGIVVLHIVALHQHGSNNPIGIDTKSPQDTIPFHPYYTVKDMFGLGVFLILFFGFVFFAPNFFGEPDNYIEANPLVTPPHIVPEWYFLPFYAILRSFTADAVIYLPISWLMSAKLAGVLAMFASIMVLFILPWLDHSPVRSARFRPLYKQFFWLLIIDCIILGICGAKPAGAPWTYIAQAATAYYFLHFIVIIPLLGFFEKTKPLPTSISEPVLKGGGGSSSAANAKPMEKA